MGLKVFNTAMVAASAGGSSPTVYTLVLDDLLTRHYPGTDQRFKLTATAGTTAFIETDDDVTILNVGALAANIESALQALTGYNGAVTVTGDNEGEAGDKYTFTITFDASLGAVTLAFHASSQWYPTITLTEAPTQQGVSQVQETVRIDYDGVSDSGETILDIGGSITVASGLVVTYTPPGGWSHSGGGDITDSFVSFINDVAGAIADPVISSGPGVLTTPTQGVTGQAEIHTITPTPVNPTGGTWKPASDVSAIAYNANTAAIDASLATSSGEFIGASSSGTLNAGVVTVTNITESNTSDTALSPVNVSLTAPEITHSIT